MKRSHAWRVSAWVTGVFCAAASVLAGCDGEGAHTSGARLEFPVQMQLQGANAVSRSGWTVTLEQADLALDSLHFFAGESVAVQLPRSPQELFRGLSRALSPRTAHAHPGHYVEGDALAELLGPPALDLLAGAELGRAAGVTGPYRSVRVTFGQARGPLAESMGDAAVRLRGVAVREGDTKHFVFSARAEQLRDAAGLPQLSGSPFDGAPSDAPSAVQARIDPAVWLAAADFSELAPGRADAPSEIEQDTRLFRQIREQVMAAAAVRFTEAP